MNRPGTFKFFHEVLPYLKAEYGETGNNEKSVEIPVALAFYSKVNYKRGRMLEVGATLPYYHPAWLSIVDWNSNPKNQHITVFPHTCLDHTSTLDGVVRTKVLDYDPGRCKFDFIVNISSSLPSVRRWARDSELVDDYTKVLLWRKTIEKMRSWLSPEGIMLITLPSSYPPELGLDWMGKLIEEMKKPSKGKDSWKPTTITKMSRIGFGMGGNVWVQKDAMKDPDLPYYGDVPSAGTVYFLVWKGNSNE